MGSMARKLKRNQKRLQFQSFTRQWSTEKRYQEEAHQAGEAIPPDKVLGTKPKFGHFLRRTRALEAIQKMEKEVEQKKKLDAEKELDLEWKDE